VEPKIKEKIPVKGMRATIAKRMGLSWKESPRVAEIVLIDVSSAGKLANEKKSANVNFNDLLIKATALALRIHPLLNSSLINDEILIFDDINICFAVALEQGLIAPVIHSADSMTLEEIAKRRSEVVEKVKAGARSPDILTGGTFTITNLGGFGVDFFTPIINYPQCGILGVGAIKERPAIVDGSIVAKPSVYLSLVFDHRIVDGAPAAKFLNQIKEFLEKPEVLRG